MVAHAGGDAERRARVERLKQTLREIAREQSLTQKQIAQRIGIPPQYLSDLIHDRRALAELVARRFGQKFGVNHVWLLDGKRPEKIVSAAEAALVLPVLRRPCVGGPSDSAFRKGPHIHLTGSAAEAARRCDRPYVLRIDHVEEGGRLRRGDLVLVAQDADPTSEFQVVVFRGRAVVARLAGDGQLRALKGGAELPKDVRRVGSCLGVVWGVL